MTQADLLDARGRALTDLRLSVTDRCNFRCRYCLPRETTGPLSFLPKAELLSFEELELLARVFVELGVRKIRLTGGEPLLRRELPKLVQRLQALGVELALTTNGVLLSEYAAGLRDAGLNRVTVSLDALDPAVFAAMCDAPSFGPADVLRGIDSAVEAGFRGVKINCVVKRSTNLSEVLPLVRHFQGSGHELRFIEYMDVGTLNAWEKAQVVPSAELRALLQAAGEVRALPRGAKNDVAEVYELPGLRVGFISSVSAPFCGNCTRARVTADGRFYTCLFGSEGLNLRQILREDPAPAEAVRRALGAAWRSRSDSYSEERATLSSNRRLPMAPATRVEMARIGG
jgi:GTP 3',8-cyclase